jgi:hypothetical protein
MRTWWGLALAAEQQVRGRSLVWFGWSSLRVEEPQTRLSQGGFVNVTSSNNLEKASNNLEKAWWEYRKYRGHAHGCGAFNDSRANLVIPPGRQFELDEQGPVLDVVGLFGDCHCPSHEQINRARQQQQLPREPGCAHGDSEHWQAPRNRQPEVWPFQQAQPSNPPCRLLLIWRLHPRCS